MTPPVRVTIRLARMENRTVADVAHPNGGQGEEEQVSHIVTVRASL